MKRTTLTLIFFLFINGMNFAQEMISNIKSDGSSIHNYIREVASNKYLISVLSTDEIIAYEIVSEDSLKANIKLLF